MSNNKTTFGINPELAARMKQLYHGMKANAQNNEPAMMVPHDQQIIVLFVEQAEEIIYRLVLEVELLKEESSLAK